MPVNLYYTQRVRGFQQENVKYLKNSAEIQLKRTKHQCPYCGSTQVTVEPVSCRQIRGEPLGNCRMWYWNLLFIDSIATIAIIGRWNIFHFSPIPKPD